MHLLPQLLLRAVYHRLEKVQRVNNIEVYIMNATDFFNKNNYVYLNEILSKDITDFLTKYVILSAQSGAMVQDEQCPKSLASYGDAVFDTLLADLCPKFSVIAGEPLLPTYTYHRLYKKGDVLEIHRDRPSCEISATVTIAVDDPSRLNALYVSNTEPRDMCDGNPIEIKVGDGVLYKGNDLWHWRKPYENEWFIQAFFHYVRADGPYSNLIFDGRPCLGVSK